MPVTMRDVAKAADVSVATVSRILSGRTGAISISEETRQKVLDAAKKLNYHPNVSARRLASQKSSTVAIVIEAYTSFGGAVNAQILQGVGARLNSAGLDALLVSRECVKNIESHLRAMVAGRKVDALLLWVQEIDPEFCAFLRETGVPHCHVGYRAADDACPTVISDNVTGGYSATNHLLKQGHRQVAIVVPKSFPEGAERFGGYRQALGDWRVPFRPEFVVQGEYRATADASVLDVEHLKEVLPQCSAIFATSDLLAMAVKEVAQGCGYAVGKDRALVGFDGSEAGRYLDPPLTSVYQDGYQIGRLAVEHILAQMGGASQKPPLTLVPTRLVVRESSMGGGAGEGGA